jgi:hypothetical protein
LELSEWEQVDSVFFEQVNITGVFVKLFGAKKVVPNQLVYTWQENEIAAGTTSFRARIKLKNNSIIYTEIISLISSGPKAIVFYPNPVSSNTALKFVLQQGISFDSQLQIIDAQGRVFRNYLSLPNQISTWNWPAGIFFYRLSSNNNLLLGSGKIWVQ